MAKLGQSVSESRARKGEEMQREFKIRLKDEYYEILDKHGFYYEKNIQDMLKGVASRLILEELLNKLANIEEDE